MNDWTKVALESRIADNQNGIRYEAGSPNQAEIECYASCLPDSAHIGIVLGMTPELRNLVASRTKKIITVDASKSAIEIYQDWLEPSYRFKEDIILGNWFELQKIAPNNVDFIVGDGVFGNILPFERYGDLLKLIFKQLSRGGLFLTRQCLAPIQIISYRDELLQLFRQEEIDGAGLGLGMRIIGYLDIAYDQYSFILDNAKVFAQIEKDTQAGVISNDEIRIIRRYYFEGKNVIPPRTEWEKMLTKAGFEFTQHILHGKSWYPWYPIYCCRKAFP
jgi:hypothetical protein